MNSTDEDRDHVIRCLECPKGKRQLERATARLDQDIRRSRFTRERAQQVFLDAVENCLSGRLRAEIPYAIRQQVANSIAEAYIGSRGNIEDQRPVRRGWRGWIAVLLGR